MAEPLIIPTRLEFTDVDTSQLNFVDAAKEISKSMSGIRKAVQDAFSGIDASAINKPIEAAMTSVKKSVQAAEDAQLRYTEALIRAGKSTQEYKSAVGGMSTEMSLIKQRLDMYEAQGFTWLPEYKEDKARFEELAKAVAKVNPLDFVDKADPLQLEKVANAYKKVLSATETVNQKSEKFNQTVQDNKMSDEYNELLKQAEAYKKKLDDIGEKSKRMEALGATDKQWETLSYDLKQTSGALDDVIKKMKIAKDTGSAFRFGDGDKGEVNNQINSFAMSNRNARKYVGGRIVGNMSPYTESFQKSLDELDQLEKKMESLKAKSDKMIELGASKKQFESLVYEAENLAAKIEEVKNRIASTPQNEAFKFIPADADQRLASISDKANSMQTALTGVANNAKEAQGGLVKLGVAHPKLAAILGTVGKIAQGFVAASKAVGKVAVGIGKVVASVGRFAGNIASGIKNLLSFGKAGRSTSTDMSKRFKKLGRNILMFGLGFRTAYYAVKRLRNIFMEGFKVMGDQFDEIGAPMKTMIESFNRLKGSLATAFQPIVSVVMPILTRLMNYLSGVLEKIGEFTAVLTGQSHIYKAIAKNVNSVAGAAKNANNQLGSYDKLEVIQDNNVGYDYEKQEIGETESVASKFAQMVKDAWKTADFTGVGAYVTEQLLIVLDNVEQNIIPKVTGFVNKVMMSINTFLTGFDATKIGAKVGSIVNAIVTGLDWAQLGAAFANINNTVWGFFDGLVNSINWVLLGEQLATGVTSIFDTLKLERWVGMISGLINGLTTALVTAVENIDWNKILNILLSSVQSLLTSVGESMVNSNNPILAAFGEVILAINDAITALKPAVESIIQAIGPLITAILPIISELLPPIAEIISDVIVMLLPPLVELIQKLLPPVIKLVDLLLPILGDLIKIIAVGLSNLMLFISNVVVPVFDVVVGIVELVTSTIGVLFKALRGDFSSVEDLFSALLSAWKKPINSILGAVESLANGVIRGLNSMINALNKLSFDVPDWVPLIGGQKFGFNIPKIGEVKIPRLAQGAVIPPNKEFLAMLGDQRHGTNIEAPLDTIKQAVAEVLAEMGGGTREPIVLQVSGRTLAKVVWDEQEKRYKQTGK